MVRALINVMLFLSLIVFCMAMYIESNHVVSSLSGMSPERVRFQKRRVNAHRSCMILALIAIFAQLTYLIEPVFAGWDPWTTRVVFTYVSALLFLVSLCKLVIARRFHGK